MNFKDKVVVITGGTSGIGKQAAIEFSRKGAHVVKKKYVRKLLKK